jgi:hypothetical protein
MFHFETVLIEKIVFQRCVKMCKAAGNCAGGDANVDRPFAAFRQVRIRSPGSSKPEQSEYR